jgi:hypothetical protein
MRPPPSIGPRSGRDQPGVSIRKRVPIVGRCFRSSSFSESCGAESPSPFAKRARDQASAVDVGSDSNCGGASRERARLRLLLIGCEAASFTTSEFDPERVAAPEVG